jgi:uncharacterized coiled-coil protein SlyX
MKATRAAVKQAKSLEELAGYVAQQQEQLDRIEALLNQLLTTQKPAKEARESAAVRK